MKSKHKKHSNNKDQAGFSLIELLVVIAIVGLIASAILAAVTSARSGGRDAKRVQEIAILQQALALYYDDNGSYPLSSGCGSTSPNSGWCNSVQSLSGGRWIRPSGTTPLSPYLTNEPVDPIQGSSPNWTPLNGGTYFYLSQTDWYMIIYGLENYPADVEDSDGVGRCAPLAPYHYGSGSNGIITVGVPDPSC